MYTTFRIQNFKGFKDLTFDDLARVNLIAGKNNTGKTSVLEAIRFHIGYYFASTVVRSFEIRDSEQVDIHQQKRTGWHNIFKNFETDGDIEFAGAYQRNNQEQALTLEIRSYDSDEVSFFPDEASQLSTNGIDNNYVTTVRIQRTKNDEEPTVIHSYINNQVTGFKKKHIIYESKYIAAGNIFYYEDDAKQFSELSLSGYLDFLVKSLQIVEPRVDSLRLLLIGGVPRIFADISLNEMIPLEAMGDGIRRLFSLISSIGTTEDGIILIDEIENGLHYSILPDVWRAIDEASRLFNVQVFATTHSYEVIRAAHEVFSEQDKDYDFRLHRLDRNNNGEISRVTYSERNLETAINMQLEVR